jgi:pantoate--beta-alanine ligase
MEGAFRPGHFKGMLEVVYRLLDIIKPDFLIMGQKDFQQFTLVKQMILQMNLSVRLIIGPTLREADGLAMSSRNQRLSSPMRKNAPEIYKNLIHIKENLHSDTPGTLSMMAIENLKKAGLRPEYVDIVDGNTLSKITNPQNHSYIVACVAVWAGDVRLIDNIVVKGNTD